MKLGREDFSVRQEFLRLCRSGLVGGRGKMFKVSKNGHESVTVPSTPPKKTHF